MQLDSFAAVSLAVVAFAKTVSPPHQIEGSLILNWQAQRLPYNSA